MCENVVSASIVLYNNDIAELSKIIESIFKVNLRITLFLIDNSPKDDFRFLEKNNILYFHNPSNPGFGAAHNSAIKKAIDLGSNYHFVINPDVYFEDDVISPMIHYMKNDPSIGMMMPQILNLDGSMQNLPKLLPNPWSIVMRKLKTPQQAYQKFIENYELRFVPQNKIYNTPILSGCFTLLNINAVKEIGMYDDRFFMYFEDWDLSRRMHQKYKTIYFPEVSVYHGYESGANKSSKLFKIFINSAVSYFNKWGWFLDKERTEINKKALAQFK